MTTAHESIAAWNRRNPPGTLVRIALLGGAAQEARARNFATRWRAFTASLFPAATLQPVQP
jgi:hypothetical protein